jgi:predicted nucleic acid-binding protein
VEFVEDNEMLKAAYELATQFNRPRTYDTQYMALAARMNCEFWTADERLFNATQGQFSLIRWQGNPTSST